MDAGPLNRQGDNQPPQRPALDAFAGDRALREAVAREDGAWADPQLHAYGTLSGGELLALGTQANSHRPVFRPVDAHGRRIDFVEFHPTWHRLMQLGAEH